jgi:anti-sigma B factor antagonist
MDTTNANNICQLRPQGEMAIYTAAELKGSLMAALDKCRAVEIDLSEVSEMDTAGMQLLILAKREALARNIDLSIVGHSAAVIEVLDLCNMTAYFGDQVVIPSATN